MRYLRRIVLLLLFVAVAGGVWGAVYAQKRGFSKTWRTLIEDEFAKRGYYTKIGKVTLGPLRGLVAEDVFFFQDPKRFQEIAFVDNVILDLDLTEILNRDLTINTLDVKDASLSLPLSPGKRASEMLRVDRFSGRLVVTESRIEIVKAQADLQGIEVTVKGSLHRPPLASGEAASDDDDNARGGDEEEQRRRLRELGRRIGALQTVLQEIDRMSFDPFKRPRLEIEFSGDLADLAGLRATGRLFAEDFRRKSYAVEELSASMEFDGEKGRAILKELHLRDAKGDLRLRADWPAAGNEVTFDLDSTADLPTLIGSIYDNPRLGEVVFFEPPRLKMEGVIRLDEIAGAGAAFPRMPFDAIGHFGSDRIGSRGTVFDGLEFNFSVSGDRYYVRNLRLDHRTGPLLANLMFDPALGAEAFRYQSEMKLDPKVFVPFVNSGDARRFLSMWDFNRNSSIYVAAMGSGPGLKPERWHSLGLIDLRRLRLNNVRFNRLEGDFEFRGKKQSYRNVRLARAEGLLVAPEAHYHTVKKKWEVANLKWSLDLVEGVRAFSPDLAEDLTRYRFSDRPELVVSGTIDGRSDEELDGFREHDFRLTFRSDQTLQHDFLGEPFRLEKPEGTVVAKGRSFQLTEFEAGLLGGTVSGDVRFENGEAVGGRTIVHDGDLFEFPPFQSLSKLVGETLPEAGAALGEAAKMTATLDWADGRLTARNLPSDAAAGFTVDGEIDPAGGTIRARATFERPRAEPGTDETIRFTGGGPFSNPDWKRVESPEP